MSKRLPTGCRTSSTSCVEYARGMAAYIMLVDCEFRMLFTPLSTLRKAARKTRGREILCDKHPTRGLTRMWCQPKSSTPLSSSPVGALTGRHKSAFGPFANARRLDCFTGRNGQRADECSNASWGCQRAGESTHRTVVGAQTRQFNLTSKYY